MTTEELLEKLKEVRRPRYESAVLEIKAAEAGCPKRLYDTLSSFSNQDDGGVILFGIAEEDDYRECGVYDAQDLQKKINEQCLQMEPPVRPLLTVAEKDGKYFVSAEIPGIDLADRPCYYKGVGRLKGSWIRVGDSDQLMTEYEIYSYEAYRKKYQDDIRVVPRASLSVLDQDLLAAYIARLKEKKPNLNALPDETIHELMSITHDGQVTLSSILLFCRYPQAYFPQLCITAIVLPGEEMGEVGKYGERFLDNRRIEGSIPEMLEEAIAFVRKNMRTKTIVDPETGRREDRGDYPITAVREAILNTLVHRDYSIHTEGMPITIKMYPNRIEIGNPGGIYGRITVDELGIKQPDTRNPVLATAMEVLQLTENRYSGIPTIRRTMNQLGLTDPVFTNSRGTFTVTLYNDSEPAIRPLSFAETSSDKEKELLRFLKKPRTRQEIADHLQIGTVQYAMQAYIRPLIESGKVKMTIPHQPRSQSQKFYTAPVSPADAITGILKGTASETLDRHSIREERLSGYEARD